MYNRPWQDAWSDHMSGGDWWWMGFMTLFWIAVLVLAVWAVTRVSRALEAHHGPAAPQRESARETLDRRYVEGQIDAVTYAEMRARIEGVHRDTGPKEDP
ncbi:hypothetical protein [Glycomyces sp. NPDC048151]|uniref:hypothetical protein n=1 Tax=Glycomyces sp. NPDC048151 TaxID=3364002 RepID=UPI003714295B